MDHLLDNVTSLVDDRVGIIRRVVKLPQSAGAPNFVYISAETCNLKIFNPHQPVEFFGGTGVATECSRAMAKAIGEALERYCSANYRFDNFPMTTFESAPFPCVPPDEFSLFSTTQYTRHNFPYVPFTRQTPIRWVQAIDLKTSEIIYIPAAMVFLPYDERDTGEPPITQQISTGLACHSTPTMAALVAIYEVVERDAIAITWQAKIPRRRIRLDTLSSQNKALVEKLQQPGTSLMLLHLSMDHDIPVVFSLMTSTVPEAPALIVAAAARLDPEQAVHKSLEELAQMWSFAQSCKSQRPKFSPGKRWQHVIDPDSHAAVYFNHANLHLATFLWDSTEAIAFGEIKNLSSQDSCQDLRCVVEQISKTKHRALVVDIATEDLKSLGIHVFRAVIPGYQPLFMGHYLRPLGGKRLWSVPQQLGHLGVNHEHQLNSAPHPFA